MVNKMISIFKPKKIKDFKPIGLNILTFNVGFKKRHKDVLLIVFDKIINKRSLFFFLKPALKECILSPLGLKSLIFFGLNNEIILLYLF